MKVPITFLLIFICSVVFSQEVPEKKSIQTYYLPLKEYKKLGKELTKQDIRDFGFHNGDTLVKMPPDYVPQKNENQFQLNYEYRKPEFLEIYKEVVFRNDSQHLRLWEKELKMFFDPSIPQKHRNAIRHLAEGLSGAVDSLKISEVEKREDANFHLYYTNSRDTLNYEPQLKNSKSGYWVYWDNRNRLERGFIKINTDSIKNPAYQIANLKHHFFYSLGMFNSSNLFKPNAYLSNSNKIRNLTALDMEILKYHYSYAKPNGVDKNGFEKFHREIQEIHQKDPSAKFYITPSQ